MQCYRPDFVQLFTSELIHNFDFDIPEQSWAYRNLGTLYSSFV